MSRIGKKPIPVPKGVQINLRDGLVEVKGPKGQLSQLLPPGVTMALEDGRGRKALLITADPGGQCRPGRVRGVQA